MRFLILAITLFSLKAYSQQSPLDVESLIENEKFSEASVLLVEKLRTDPIDIRDVLLLGSIYEKLDLPKKALKVYLLGIKKIHGESWRQFKNYGNLIESLDELREPSKEALLLAFKVAVLYYDLFLVSDSSDQFRQRILDTSLKYFTICRHFNFNLLKTHYYLGLIYRENGVYDKAGISFLKAWTLYDLKLRKDEERDQKLSLMLGESLINYGHVESGAAHLRTLYYDMEADIYLRKYAAEYLDEFKGSSVGGSLSFIVGHDSNVPLGNATGFETIKGSSYTSKAASLFVSHSPSYSSSYNFNLNFSEDLYTESTLKDFDGRTLSFFSSWDYKKIDQTILTVNYIFSKSYLRSTAASEFDPDSSTHQLRFVWTNLLRNAKLSFSFPFSRTFYESGTQNDARGLGISFEPIRFSKNWNPIYAVDFSLLEEEEGFEESKNLLLSFTNAIEFSPEFSGSLDLSYEKNSNTDSSLSFTERVLSFSLLYSFKNIQGLGLEGSIGHEGHTSDSGLKETRFKTGLGLNYLL